MKHKKVFSAIIVFVVLLLSLLGGTLLFAHFKFAHKPFQIPKNDQLSSEFKNPIAGGLSVRYLGITMFEISDSQTTIITDAAMTRPTMLDLLKGPLKSDTALIDRYVRKADFILINHSHYDHVVDAHYIAKKTGATVVGSENTLNLMRSRGIPESKLIRVKDGDTLLLKS